MRALTSAFSLKLETWNLKPPGTPQVPFPTTQVAFLTAQVTFPSPQVALKLSASDIIPNFENPVPATLYAIHQQKLSSPL